MFYQKTIREPVTVEGIGLHTGKPTRMTFKPAPANTGVFLVRKDISGSPALKVQSSNVKATQMATVVGGDLFAVYTVEHCMSAVAAFRIDNIFIELEGPELPICDGSASAYFQALKQVGIQEQAELREYLYITQPIYYAQGEKYAYALPYNGFKMTSTIEFPHPKIGKQKFEIEITAHSFEAELSTARIFGFLCHI
jgi:UDP-3-O-[3-hydroxymyristoyl] N-acetylglucosamine deacetylase